MNENEQLQTLAAYVTLPDPDPATLGDPDDWHDGPRQAVWSLQHGATIEQALTNDLLRKLIPLDPDAKPDPAECQDWAHDALLAQEFAPQSWIVPDLVLSDDLTWIGGRKKLGKSLLCLQMAQAVASGGHLLQKRCARGRVLYLCLEDGPRRLQGRLKRQNTPNGLDIQYITRFAPLDVGGLAALRDLLAARRPKLVIIDTLAAAKTGKLDENAAGDMGDLANGLRILAQDYHAGLVVVVHHGKVATGDPGFDIRGSSAQAGASAVNVGLYRDDNGTYTLKAEGRDIEGAELRIALDVPTLSWGLVGDARMLARRDADGEILEALQELGEGDAAAIARECGRDRTTAMRALKRMAREGTITTKQGKIDGRNRVLYTTKEP